MKKVVTSVLSSVALLLPFVVGAQGYVDTIGGGSGGGGRGIEGLIDKAGVIVESLIPIVLGIALLVFFWGMVKFIAAAGSEDAKEQGKRIMIWGIIALFVMISVWGLVNFIQDALLDGVDTSAPDAPLAPQVR